MFSQSWNSSEAKKGQDVLMKQVLDRGRTDRREKEAKCGHCRGPKSVRAAGSDARMDPKRYSRYGCRAEKVHRVNALKS